MRATVTLFAGEEELSGDAPTATTWVLSPGNSVDLTDRASLDFFGAGESAEMAADGITRACVSLPAAAAAAAGSVGVAPELRITATGVDRVRVARAHARPRALAPPAMAPTPVPPPPPAPRPEPEQPLRAFLASRLGGDDTAAEMPAGLVLADLGVPRPLGEARSALDGWLRGHVATQPPPALWGAMLPKGLCPHASLTTFSS